MSKNRKTLSSQNTGPKPKKKNKKASNKTKKNLKKLTQLKDQNKANFLYGLKIIDELPSQEGDPEEDVNVAPLEHNDMPEYLESYHLSD